MDLDEEELKATRRINGADRSKTDEIEKLKERLELKEKEFEEKYV